MLWRALKHVENGFYVDVGAWSPDVDSVTKAFYESGWRGINIEPNPEFNQALRDRRPRDTNLQIALGDVEGDLAMNFLANPGLSTLDDSIAERHHAAGLAVSREVVKVATLSAIWAEHVPDGQEVHFLKVDVEGYEKPVLQGNDWMNFRPWVVVVEATLPMTQEESHESWEPILLAADYRFAYADGLNRYYIALEHIDLLPRFKYPPNVFDAYKPHAQEEAEAQAQQAEERAQQAQAQVQQAEERAQQAQAQAQQADALASTAMAQLDAVYKSTSWRVTAPMRFAVDSLSFLTSAGRRFQSFVIRGSITFCQRIVGFVISRVRRYPRFSYWANRWLLKTFPHFRQQLIEFSHRSKITTNYIPKAALVRNVHSTRLVAPGNAGCSEGYYIYFNGGADCGVDQIDADSALNAIYVEMENSEVKREKV